MSRVLCPYCLSKAKLVSGADIYPHRKDLASRKFWACSPCDAYVGCHKQGAYTFNARGDKLISDGTLPLGRLANAELRAAKRRAHEHFDLLWQDAPNTYAARRTAYAWLAGELGIPVTECHIGEFDVARCAEVVRICEPRLMQLLEAELADD